MNWFTKLFKSNEEDLSHKDLAKLIKIAAQTYRAPAAFGNSLRGLGYKCVEQTPWGTLIFEKQDCRVTLSSTTTRIQNLMFRSNTEGITHDIVKEGVLVN